MKIFFIVLFILIAGIFIFIALKYPSLIGISSAATAPVNTAAYTAFINECTSKPYNNTAASCNQAWPAAQKLGLSTYTEWAKWQCDHGNC